MRERTRALTSANERLTSQWTRLRRANEIQERGARHRRARPAQSAWRHPRPRRDDERAGGDEPGPLDKISDQLGHIRASASQLTGMVNDLISDAMMDAHDIAIKREPVDLAALLGEIVDLQPRARREEAADHPVLASPAAPAVELRSRPAARGRRQSAEQCHQVQPDRRPYRADDEASTTTAPSFASQDEGAGPFAGRRVAAVRPLSAPLGQADRRRELDRAWPLDRQAHRRTARRPRHRRKRRPRPGRDLHHPAAGRGSRTAPNERTQHIIVVDDEAPAREMVGDYLQAARLRGDAVRRRRRACAGSSPSSPRPDRARPQHAGGGRPFDRARASSSRRRADHHADRDRERDRSRGRARARRRRLSGQAVRAARAPGAHPFGAAPQRRAGAGAATAAAPRRQAPCDPLRHQMARHATPRCCATTTATSIRSPAPSSRC